MPVWPWADRQIKRIRELLPIKRVVRKGSGAATIALADTAMGSAEAFGVPSIVRSDETLDERFTRLEARMQLLEEQVANEQARAEKAERLLEERVAQQGRRLDDADDQLRALTKSVAVSSDD